MKKLKLASILIIAVLLTSCNDSEIAELKIENQRLNARIEALELELNMRYKANSKYIDELYKRDQTIIELLKAHLEINH